MSYMNQGNWGSFLQAVPQGVEKEQDIQAKDYGNQQARAAADQARRDDQAATEKFPGRRPEDQFAGRPQHRRPEQSADAVGGFQQSGGVFDPARNAIHSALANIGQYYQKVFHPQQGQTNPAAAPSGRGPGPAAQQTLPGPGQTGAQAPAAMSRPQAGSSGPAAPGTTGATGPMPLPQQDQITGRQYPAMAEGGAIPGRKLQGIRAKKAKAGNVAKATAGDKQVANQQPGAGGPQLPIQAQGGPARNTEPGAGISNQDPQLADGGEPKKWVQGAIKKPGQLHRDLGVPEGEKIPKSKIKAAEKGGGKVAKRAQLADTMSKWKDGGMPKLPKLEPGAAPEPKPAPNAVEQTVSNDGMRHYLGKTIKRYADGDTVTHEPNAEVPTPAGLQPMGDPNQPNLIQRATGALTDFLSQPGEQSLAERAGLTGGTNPAPPGLAGPSAQPAPEPSPGKGVSPPQQNAASSGPPPAPAQPRGVHADGTPMTDEEMKNATPITAEQNANLLANAKNRALNGRGYEGDDPTLLDPGSQGPPSSHAHGQPGSVQQGPPNPNTAPVDFSKVQADQSQVPTMSTQDWQQMKNGIIRVATAHGMSGGQAEMTADEEVTKYQHGNFMQYMQQAQALDAAGNKQGAMAALKTAYQFFPTGHDMHFGLAPNGDILGYAVDEKTGQPVQNGLVHLNQQNLAAIHVALRRPEGVRR